MRTSSIQARLNGAFIGLAVIPMLIVGGFFAWRSFTLQEAEALATRRHIAKTVATEISSFINGRVDELTMLARVRGLEGMDVAQQRSLLSELLSFRNTFSELAYLDAKGRERVRLSHVEVIGPEDLRDHSGSEVFRGGIGSGETWYGPVELDAATGEPLMTVAVPVPSARGQAVSGVLAARIRLKTIWHLVAAVPVVDAGDAVYVADGSGWVVAHRNPSVVLRGTHIDLPDSDGLRPGLNGEQVMLGINRMRFGSQTLIVVAEKSVYKAMELAFSTLLVIAVVTGATFAAAAVMVFLARRSIIRPIRQLAKVARQIRDGDLTRQAEVTSRDEIGDLAEVFNGMTGRLRDSLDHLRQSEEKFRSVSQSAHDAIIVTDDQGLIVSWNRGASDIFGYDQDEVMGQPLDMLIPSDYRDKHDASRLRAAMADDETMGRTIEVQGLCRDGSRVPLELSVASYVTGTRRFFSGILRDITERRRAEETLRQSKDELEIRVAERTRALTAEIAERQYIERALRESEQRFRDMAEAASDWFWEMADDLRFTYLSRRAQDANGISVRFFIGRTLEACVDPQDLDADPVKWEAIRADMAQRRPFRDFSCMLGGNGRPECTLRLSGKPFFDDDGRFLGYRGIAGDITEQRRAEALAVRAQRQLQDAIENISEGFLLFDADDEMVLCNSRLREFYPDLAPRLLPGLRFRDMLQASVDARIVVNAGHSREEWMARRLERRQQGSYSHVQRLRTGRWLLVNERRTASRQTVGIYTDITELKTVEQELRRAKSEAEAATSAKSEFLANMSHELRTPLNAIIGFSDTMLSHIFGPINHPRYEDYIGNIHQSGCHLLELINDILDLSKVEAGKIQLERDKVEISPLIDQALTMMRDRAAATGVSLDSRIEPNLPPLWGDSRRLLQILLNLLSNAVKFTPEGGAVAIRALLDPAGGIEIAVADTGIGIAPQDISKVMEAFGQVESAQSRRYQGTGLGLPLAKQLVELHGGSFDLRSSVGVGTTITLRFPPQLETVG